MHTTPISDMDQQQNVNEAFSRQSAIFDSIDEKNQILQWMRARIRRHVTRLIPPQSNILELNAGTGLDSVYFAKLGHKVLATDNADGMIEVMKRKVKKMEHGNRIKVQKCSFTDLSGIEGGPFDCIFSNFGGLNCVQDPGKVIRQFPALLKPGGTAILVIMPPVCPWELLLALKGNFKVAFRRLKKNGVNAHMEGVNFLTWYFTPSSIIKGAGPEFRRITVCGLSSLAPPPFMEKFPKRFPSLFKKLKKWDENVERKSPFNSMNDHFLISLKYVPEQRT